MREIKRLWQRTRKVDTVVSDGGSYQFVDQTLIESFNANPNNTYLVSFPRTGSHWLRMLMELYFGRPSLTRIFYYPERQNFLALHTHDIDLDVERATVIYLYRDPVDTIYSQLMYYQEDIEKQDRIVYWGDLYGRHLDKWLIWEQFTEHKTIVTYEGMKKDLLTEFDKICQHFSLSLDIERLEAAAAQVTTDEVKRKTKHDVQVVQLQEDYQVQRQEFRMKWANMVWQVVTAGRPYLLDHSFPGRKNDPDPHS
jgi:hypothetical protein